MEDFFLKPETITKKKKTSGWKLLVRTLGVIMILGFLCAFVDNFIGGNDTNTTSVTAQKEEKKRPTPAAETNIINFIVAAESEYGGVRDYLLSPTTAEFPSIEKGMYKVKIISDDVVILTSYVDSENRFGAKTRKIYHAKLQREHDDYWKVVNVKFDGSDTKVIVEVEFD
ncbi:MAG: hypothetical protein KBS54_00595 [Synergistaceae bacterium]|nr:hypothetical protein [Candidatus Equadaptatus faecalis]